MCGPVMDSDSDTSEGDYHSDDELDYAWAQQGYWGHWPGKCDRKSNTCVFKVKHGVWGNRKWTHGDDCGRVPRPPAPGKANFYMKTQGCTRGFGCPHDGAACWMNPCGYKVNCRYGMS
ncbi:hypothetical protein PLIIFM63780_008590 [Purpureocillium lilacinum]|uniref:Uncharacterized protein n=1 Tax=Purpureocillium lilacinum TaxID=33203 RepID=A0A2U3DYW6_PURLI|nr:hypothetical protein Purlil1_627 [Purpureocillium lilacinum]PWI67416.1 hypothetical protein PCL_03184 [Purpureocillium lilacinum]GJN85026.1 hypothetical protein PLIIFM63780_008590 [Purpureocillium lilacinum]